VPGVLNKAIWQVENESYQLQAIVIVNWAPKQQQTLVNSRKRKSFCRQHGSTPLPMQVMQNISSRPTGPRLHTALPKPATRALRCSARLAPRRVQSVAGRAGGCAAPSTHCSGADFLHASSRTAYMQRLRSPLSRPPAAVAAWFGTLEAEPSRAAAAAAAAAATAAAAAAPPPPPTPALVSGGTTPAAQQTLVQQRFSVHRSRYSAPREMEPQAGQLIGLIFTLLGPPSFNPSVPGLRHPNTMSK